MEAKKKYIVKDKFKNCRVCSVLGVFILNDNISQKDLKTLYDNGHNDKIDYC